MSPRRDKVVVLGMMTKMPVAGVVWQTVHYLLGLDLLGFDAYYVEAHARTPSMLMTSPVQDSSAIAAAFIASVMHRFGFDRQWAFHARHADDKTYGMSRRELENLYREAACILNLHGGTEPLPEHSETGRLVYVETDPVQLQAELAAGHQPTHDFLSQHCAHFSFAENWGRPDCLLPPGTPFAFQPTRQPVVLELWRSDEPPAEAPFTTVGNWDQAWRDVVLDGETYRWSKKHEFLRFLELPDRTSSRFELALSAAGDADRTLLRAHGWTVIDGLGISRSIDEYRGYIRRSRGEFTVAKDQNVRLRTGWFSDRSATYLAAGRPVITQDTGFGSVLPTGQGLFSFSSLEEILGAVASIESDQSRHNHAAKEVARQYFAHDVVLPPVLASVGLSIPRTHHATGARIARTEPAGQGALRADLVIEPASKNPLTLPTLTIKHASSAPLPRVPCPPGSPTATIVVVTHNNPILSRLCLESVLVNTEAPAFDLVVVDNGSSAETIRYLSDLDALHQQVQLRRCRENLGFPRAVNLGLSTARGDILVILNNDTIVTPGWLSALATHLEDETVGMVGPVTNQAPNEAKLSTSYRTYGEMLAFAGRRPRDGAQQEVPMLTMFCAATRRDVFEKIGALDEHFGIGTFEDDDYAVRLRAAGYRLLCAEDAFVHHFGQASLGTLIPSGKFQTLFDANRTYFERKWGVGWEPHQGRTDEDYARFCEEVLAFVHSVVPPGSRVAVVSKGDDRLLDIEGSETCHFPGGNGGSYGGYYPADSGEAVAWLEDLRAKGCTHLVVPATSAWWLDHYEGLRDYLDLHAERCAPSGPCTVFHFVEGGPRLHRPGVEEEMCDLVDLAEGRVGA